MSQPTRARRRTKIVATLGPASREPAVLARLVEAGMDVARINLSHGTLEEHEQTIASARLAAARAGAPLAILLDLPGPKLRVGELAAPLAIAAGDEVVLAGSPGDGEGDAPATAKAPHLPVNFPDLLPRLAAGDSVLVDAGAVALLVRATAPQGVVLQALNDGVVASHKGVNLPDSRLPLSALTSADRRLLEWGLRQDVDYIALSFVRSADDVRELKELVAAGGGDQLIVAKIEKKEALGAYEEIVAEADAVMVARGDLGVEVDAAVVPVWQKRIIRASVLAGKPVITATQMLQSMIAAPRPTRAEASDVANAIYDATSAVMLSGETAVGAYPDAAVRTAAGIALVVEDDIAREGRPPRQWGPEHSGVSDAISSGACEVAHRVGATAIVTATFSGATARAVARNLPDQPIVAITPNQRVANQLALCWGVSPLLGRSRGSFEDVTREANDLVLAGGYGQAGEVIVITAGLQANQPGKTNLIKAHTLG